jgi:Tfp pilus assembly protein PilO
MQKREKMLAAVVASLVVLLVCYSLVGRVLDAFSSRRTQISTLKAALHEKQNQEKNGQQAARQLAEWEHRSLPSNQAMARTLYQTWLVQATDRVKLKNANIDPGRGSDHRKIYFSLPFTLQARGSLDQVVAFLHEFYSANHLHQLRSASIKPVQNSTDLDLNFSIEALVLPGADRRDELNEEKSDRLKLATLDAYKQKITTRNLFAQYTPPVPKTIVSTQPSTTPRPSFDPAKFAVLTAILEVGDGPQAWVSVKTSGEVIRLREGDKVSVGQFNGTVTRINVSDIEIEAEGKRRQLALGKSLPQAIELPPPAAAPTESPVPAEAAVPSEAALPSEAAAPAESDEALLTSPASLRED